MSLRHFEECQSCFAFVDELSPTAVSLTLCTPLEPLPLILPKVNPSSLCAIAADSSWYSEEREKVCYIWKVGIAPSAARNKVFISHSMNVSTIDGKWSLDVCGLPVPASSPALETMDNTTSVDKLQGLLKRIEAMNICDGNDDDRFVSLRSPRSSNDFIMAQKYRETNCAASELPCPDHPSCKTLSAV